MQEAVARRLQSRVRASQPGQSGSVSGASSRVSRYERDRSSYMAALGQRFDWQGQIRGYSTRIDSFELAENDDSHAGAVLCGLGDPMAAKPAKVEPTYAKARASEPAKYGLGEGDQEVLSAAGVWHETRLEPYSGGWSIAFDAHREPTLFGESPDAGTSDFITAATQFDLRQAPGPEPAANSFAQPAGELAPPVYTYDYAGAATYAENHQKPDANWYQYAGSQCGYAGRYRGNDVQRYSNWNLRKWVINQGRGVDKTGISGLGKGDIVNFDWNQNGTFGHVSIVTNAANNLVTCHNTDLHKQLWQLGDSNADHKFTSVSTYYEA